MPAQVLPRHYLEQLPPFLQHHAHRQRRIGASECGSQCCGVTELYGSRVFCALILLAAEAQNPVSASA